jgi:hypothetical protein
MLDHETRLNLRLDPDDTYDAMMFVRSVCDDRSSEEACYDIGPPGTAEETSFVLGPGAHYLFIDGWNARDDDSLSDGDFTLTYSFYPDPCADDDAACPGEPVCLASGDWSSFSCVCETPGEAYRASDGTCVDDPCDPDPCEGLAHRVCEADLSAGTAACGCVATYVDDGAGGCRVAPDAEWTVMVYWAQDNPTYAQAEHELEDVAAATLTADVRVVGLVDRYGEGGAYVEFEPGGMERVVELGDVDSGDWHTLRDFGVWAVESFPAQHYALVVSDQVGTWKTDAEGLNDQPPALRGICRDDGSARPGAGISISDGDLDVALQGIASAAGRPLDLVVYDAALAGEWELVDATEPFADFMIAPPAGNSAFMIEAGAWTAWLDALAAGAGSMSGLEAGEAFMDLYRASMERGSPFSVTAALTDLSTASDLDDAVSALADALVDNENEAFYEALDGVRARAQRYDQFELVDLGDLARLLSESGDAPPDVVSASEDLLAQLDLSVVDSLANPALDWSPYFGSPELAGSTGLSIYFPGPRYRLADAYRDFGAVWSDRATWDEFLETFVTGSYWRCSGDEPVESYFGTPPGDAVTIDACCNRRILSQTFRAPGTELNGVRIAVRKTAPDGGETQGFFFGLSRAASGYLRYVYVPIEPNDGDVQVLCLETFGVPTEPGEELQIVLSGATPYPGYPGDYPSPVEWLIEYAADASSDPPCADGVARVYDDGTEVPVAEFNGDGVAGTFWFEVY